MKFVTQLTQHYPPHLRHVATLPWEITNATFLQIPSTFGKKCKQIAFLSPLPLLFMHKFRYFQCLKSRVFPRTDCKYNFLRDNSFTCLLLRSICGTRNSTQQCLSITNMVYSVTRTRFWKKRINKLRIYSYAPRGIKIGTLRTQFVCIFFHMYWIYAKNCISQGSVAICLRWGGNVECVL